jgi:2-methylisocitrate lyase-like PEP mutase family enzyme
MMEGGNLPVLKPSELAQMGFQMSIYGISLLVRITRLMRESLADLKSERLEMVGSGVSLDEYNNIVGLPAWMKYEDS